ncbi:MAG: hypothetical protein ABSH45_11635 [Bryobacteraceae bacterium]|jgi:hypothetical protein
MLSIIVRKSQLMGSTAGIGNRVERSPALAEIRKALILGAKGTLGGQVRTTAVPFD